MHPQSQKPLQQDQFPSRVSIEPLRTSIAESDIKTIQFKLINYQNLDTHQKLVTIDNLPIMLDQLGKEGLPLLKPLLQQIAQDKPNISSKLLNKIEQMTSYIEKYEVLDKCLKETLIPIIIKYFDCQDIQTKEQAGKQLGFVATKLNQKDRGEYVLKYVLLLSHDDNNQNNRLVAVQLLSNLSQCFGKQLCQQFIGLQFLSLGDDTSQKVRKQAIKKLPIICKMVSPHFFNTKILPFYYEKSIDSINWGIRKACGDIIISITQYTQQHQRQTKLTNVMLKLTKDSNRWVKNSAYLNLGKFIYYLKGFQVHEKLFKRFLKMTEKQIVNLGNENQVPYNCAFNFPAVVSVMGPQKWPQMFKTYQKLLKINDKRIRLTLSQSLFQIAKIIGGKNTQKYLFDIIDNFLKDQNDDIKLAIIQNMAEIIFVLNDKKRQEMIEVFQEFQKNQAKWRIRQSIAKQFNKLIQIYPPDIVNLYIVPILISLCSDPVSIVRQSAGKTVYNFVQNFKTNKNIQIGLIQSFKAFAISTLYHNRLQFIYMCRYLIVDRKIFDQHLSRTLIDLKNDKVINVRLALAQFIKDMKKMMSLQENSIESQNNSLRNKFQKVFNELKLDQSQEVQQVLQQDI